MILFDTTGPHFSFLARDDLRSESFIFETFIPLQIFTGDPHTEQGVALPTSTTSHRETKIYFCTTQRRNLQEETNIALRITRIICSTTVSTAPPLTGVPGKKYYDPLPVGWDHSKKPHLRVPPIFLYSAEHAYSQRQRPDTACETQNRSNDLLQPGVRRMGTTGSEAPSPTGRARGWK